MRSHPLIMTTLLVVSAGVCGLAQAPVGPVAPRQVDTALPQSAAIYEKALTKTLDADADVRWSDSVDGTERLKLLESAEALRMKVQYPVGPVPPIKPPPKPPTRRDVKDGLTQLRDALKQAGTTAVAPDVAKGLNTLIAQLDKSARP